MFVDGLLEVRHMADADRERIDSSLGPDHSDVTSLLDRVGSALSGITRGASLVLAPKQDSPIKHLIVFDDVGRHGLGLGVQPGPERSHLFNVIDRTIIHFIENIYSPDPNETKAI